MLKIPHEEYYRQLAIEFRRDFLKWGYPNDHTENIYDFGYTYINLDKSTSMNPLKVLFESNYYIFTVNKEEQVMIHSDNIIKFFDEDIDKRVIKDLKNKSLKESEYKIKKGLTK